MKPPHLICVAVAERYVRSIPERSVVVLKRARSKRSTEAITKVRTLRLRRSHLDDSGRKLWCWQSRFS